MEGAERAVLLTDGPRLPVEFDLDDVLRVSPVVRLVLHHLGVHDGDREGDLEEEGASTRAVLRARLHVVDEDLRRVEDGTEFALHGHGVLEHALINLDGVHLGGELSVALLNVRDRGREILIRAHQLLVLLRPLHRP